MKASKIQPPAREIKPAPFFRQEDVLLRCVWLLLTLLSASLTALGQDTDGDGIPDDYEINHGLNPLVPTDGGKSSGFSDDNGQPLTWLQLFHYNFGANRILYNTVSREVSVFNFGQATANKEAVSKEVSVFNSPPDTDGDGIDDAYETNHGLNLNDAGDANRPSGFTDASGHLLTWLQLYHYNFDRNSTLYDGVTREVSVFNFGQPTANYEAVSKEVSVFSSPQDTDSDGIDDAYETNHGLSPNDPTDANRPSGFTDATGHPLTWLQLYHYNFGRNSTLYDAVSLEVSVFNFGQPTANSEAFSKEVSVFNFGQPTATLEAISREVSVFTTTTVIPPQAGPFINGSFELPDVVPLNSARLVSKTNATDILGWVADGPTAIYWFNGKTGRPGVDFDAVDGTHQLNFNGGNMIPGASISQTFSTKVGESYLISFFVGKMGNGPGEVSLTASVSSELGSLLGSLKVVPQPTEGWGGYGAVSQIRFTASTATSTLSFLDTSLVTDSVDVMLDNVSVIPLGTNCVPPPSGLVAWWPGEGNANDVIGGHNGTLQNGATFGPGKVGQAFSFDGVDDYVDFGTSSAFDLADFTVAAWVMIDPATNIGDQRVISRDDILVVPPNQRQATALKSSAGFVGAPGHPAFGFGFESSVIGHSSADLVAPNALGAGWHHLAGVRAGNNAALYVDGVFAGASSSPVPIGILAPKAPLVLGQVSPAYNNEFFVGRIDEPALYSRALNPNEIAAIYAAGSAGLCPPDQNCIPPPSGLVAWWPGEGNANDVIGGNTGSFENGATAAAAGVVGAGFDFNGINSMIRVPDSPALHVGTRSFSVCAWVNARSFGTWNTVSSKRDPRSALTGWSLVRDMAGFWQANLIQSGTQFLVRSDSPAQLGRFVHLVLVADRESNRLKLFVDGTLQPGEIDISGAGDLTSNDPLRIGAEDTHPAPGTPFPFDGVIDELAIWNRALSDTEIAAIHAAGSAGMCAVQLPPSIVTQPQAQAVAIGGSATFSAAGGGTEPFRYQWRKNGVNLDGATGATFTIPRVQLSDGGSYTVAVSNDSGSVESAPAVLRIVLPLVKLTDNFTDRRLFTDANFTGTTNNNNPAASAEVGEPRHAGKRGGKSLWMTWKAPASGVVTFSTIGSSFDTLLAVYTGSAINSLSEVASDEDRGGFLTSKLEFNAVAGTDYQIAVDGFAGASGVVVLSWDLVADAPALPVITQQPKSVLAVVGDAVQFTVSAQPAGVTYQWLLNGQNLAGQTASVLSLTADASRVGTYRAHVTAPNGQTLDSADAILEVLDQPQPNLRLSADKLDDLFDPGEIALANLSRVGLNANLPVSQGWMQEADMSQSTRSPEDPEPCGVITSVTRWFRIRPIVPASGRAQVRLSTEGSDVPTVLGVFTNRFALTLVRCSPGTDANSKNAVVGFDAVQGVDYLVMVGRLGEGAGKVRLSYRGAEELPDFARVWGLEAGRLQVQILVVPGKYDWSWSDDVRTWTPIFQTNVPSGLFQYSEPLQLSAPVRLFRLLPGK